MTNFKRSNFGKQNTPPLIQKIGDIALIAAGIGGSIMGLPVALAAAGIAVTIPPIILTVGGYATAVGIFGKLLTKFFGKVEQKQPE